MKIRPFIAGALLLGVAGWVIAEDAATVGLQVIGTKHTSSFPKLLLMRVDNTTYAPFGLAKAMAASSLIIDGKPSARKDPHFAGPAGIAPMGQWDGCVSFDDYAPPITKGKHKVSFKLGETLTAPISIQWEDPINWKQGNLKTRLKEIHELGDALTDGLPQACVERWLTVKDGGQQSDDKIRYVLEPQFKISLPYRKAYEAGVLHSVVDGPAKVYEEARLHD